MKAAPATTGTTLYLSELNNGLLFTLSVRHPHYGEHEKHFWKTSLPLLELLYPHWVGKQPLNTPIDFMSQALKRAEDAFGWKLLKTSRQLRVPEVSFGDGIAQLVIVKERMTHGYIDEIAKDNYTTVIDRSTDSIGAIVASKASVHQGPFVVVIANFFSIEIVECVPRSLGGITRWDYKVSKMLFDTKQKFVDYIASKKYAPFIAEHIPENLLLNTMLNYTYWKPVATSSTLVKDIWRAFLTQTLSEISVHTSIQEMKNATVYLTGEIPIFTHDVAAMQLALVDGLGLSGIWQVVIDEHYQMIPLFYDKMVDNVFELLNNSALHSMWIIPQSKKNGSVTDVILGDATFKGISGNIYTYCPHEEIHNYEVEENGKKIAGKVVDWMSVKQIVIDKRAWPVVYGPNIVANSVKIPQWLHRIRKIIPSN